MLWEREPGVWLRAGIILSLPCKNPTSPNMSPSPSGPTWALWRTSPSGGLIMSPERTSRVFCFLPRFVVDVFKYMGVLAGILFPSILCQMCDDVCRKNGEEPSPQCDINSFIRLSWFLSFISLNFPTAAGSDVLYVWNSSEAPGTYPHNCRSEEQTKRRRIYNLWNSRVGF